MRKQIISIMDNCLSLAFKKLTKFMGVMRQTAILDGVPATHGPQAFGGKADKSNRSSAGLKNQGSGAEVPASS